MALRLHGMIDFTLNIDQPTVYRLFFSPAAGSALIKSESFIYD